MHLRIRYRSGEDVVSEREVSAVSVEAPNTMHAFCHTREEERTFNLDRIEHALDMESGEVIPDIWLHLGLESRNPPPLKMPVFSGRKPAMTAEELRNLRKADKNALFQRFKYEVIAQAKRRSLWASFSNSCFRCGSKGPLELDHHVPQDLGGRLVPGNVVLLCSSCNLQKRASHPSVFYSDEQLSALEPILKAQLQLFEFRFNWTRWTRHPDEYLVSLGVTEDEARAALCDPASRFYVGHDPRL